MQQLTRLSQWLIHHQMPLNFIYEVILLKNNKNNHNHFSFSFLMNRLSWLSAIVNVRF